MWFLNGLYWKSLFFFAKLYLHWFYNSFLQFNSWLCLYFWHWRCCHTKHSARLWLSASLAAGMNVYEHGSGNGQAAHVHTRTHSHTTRHDEPVPQLSSHRMQRCNTFPRGSFCSLECNHHETKPQIRFLFLQFPARLGSAPVAQKHLFIRLAHWATANLLSVIVLDHSQVCCVSKQQCGNQDVKGCY